MRTRLATKRSDRRSGLREPRAGWGRGRASVAPSMAHGSQGQVAGRLRPGRSWLCPGRRVGPGDLAGRQRCHSRLSPGSFCVQRRRGPGAPGPFPPAARGRRAAPAHSTAARAPAAGGEGGAAPQVAGLRERVARGVGRRQLVAGKPYGAQQFNKGVSGEPGSGRWRELGESFRREGRRHCLQEQLDPVSPELGRGQAEACHPARGHRVASRPRPGLGSRGPQVESQAFMETSSS